MIVSMQHSMCVCIIAHRVQRGWLRGATGGGGGAREIRGAAAIDVAYIRRKSSRLNEDFIRDNILRHRRHSLTVERARVPVSLLAGLGQ